MPIQAILGGDHAGDRQYPRQPRPQKVVAHEREDEEHDLGGRPTSAAFVHGSIRLVVDDMKHVVLVQVIDTEGQVLAEIPPDQLDSLNYHGVLVDVNT